MDQRLYRVRLSGDPEDLGRLVSAKHPAQALRHVAEDTWTVDLPTALEAAALVAAGVKVEDANGEPANASPQPEPDPNEPPF